jgi:hypothetical protein
MLMVVILSLLLSTVMSAVGHAAAGMAERHYELVSPPDKNSSAIFNGVIAHDGGRVVITAAGGLDGGGLSSPSLAVRASDGTWDTRSLLPPSDQRPYTGYLLVAHDPNLTQFLAESTSSLFGGGAPAALVHLDDHAHQTILSTYTAEINGLFTAVSADDLSHVYASVNASFDPDDPPGSGNIYDIAKSPPLLVSRLPDGTVPACGAGLVSTEGSGAQRQTARDGSTVFFSSSIGPDLCGFSSNLPILFARDVTAGTTAMLSGPPLSGLQTGVDFLQGSADGTQAFFATATQLTPDDTDLLGDVYRWTKTSGLTCITCIATVPANIRDTAGRFRQTVAVAPDLSRMYFVSQSALAPGGIDGENNLYVWHTTPTSGPAGTIDYIAPNSAFMVNNPLFGSELTPDGNTIIFSGGGEPALDVLSGSQSGGHVQLYRYHDSDHTLTCVSCPPHTHQQPTTSPISPAGSSTLIMCG